MKRTLNGNIAIGDVDDSDAGNNYINSLNVIHPGYVGSIDAGEGDLVAASFRAKAAELARLKSEN